MADKYGWNKQKVYTGNHSGHCNFHRNTTNKNIKIWIVKIENEYEVQKSKHLGNYQFENEIIKRFKTAVKAKEWANEEYKNILLPAE